MTPSQRELWQRIRDFDIDGGPVRFSYAQRLAKENAWSRSRAHRVIEEYRRFLFLAAEAGHPVSPSDEVDQAWHLHMLYTDSYWNRLGKQVLPKPLHHGPSKGGKAESDKFEDWYARTLDSYRRLFGEEPPRDIWNQDKREFKRVDAAENWVLPKRPIKLGALTLVGIAAVAGCEATNDSATLALFVILGLAILFALIVVIIKAAQSGSSGASGCSTTTSSCGSGCGGGHSHGHDGGHDGSGDGGDGGSDGGGDGGGCGSSCGGGCGGGGD